MSYISISTDVRSHWIFQNDKYFKWWMIILIELSNRDSTYVHRNSVIELEENQVMKSIEAWSSLFGCNERTTKKFFLLLEKTHMISIEKSTKRTQQPTLIKLMVSDMFCAKRTQQNTQQSTEQNTQRNSEQKPTYKRVKKEPTTTYSKCVEIYYNFYESRNGIPPKFDKVMGSKMKSIIKHLEVAVIKRNPLIQDNKEEVSKAIVDSFQYVFSNWHKLDDFWQGQIDIAVIDSKFNTIIDQIKNNGNGRKANGKLSKAEQDAINERKWFEENFGDGTNLK